MSQSTNPAATPLRERVEGIINQLRPAIQSDGGDLEFVSVDENGIVQVRLHGACIGCPSAAMTLKFGVERTLKTHVPEITEVVCV